MHRLATFADSLAQGKGEGQGEEVRGGHREWCRASADPTLPYHSQGSQRTSKIAWCTRACLFCTCILQIQLAVGVNTRYVCHGPCCPMPAAPLVVFIPRRQLSTKHPGGFFQGQVGRASAPNVSAPERFASGAFCRELSVPCGVRTAFVTQRGLVFRALRQLGI